MLSRKKWHRFVIRNLGSRTNLFRATVNTPPQSTTLFSAPHYADANAEQLLWNQCGGNLRDTNAVVRTRSAVFIRLLTGSGARPIRLGAGRTGPA